MNRHTTALIPLFCLVALSGAVPAETLVAGGRSATGLAVENGWYGCNHKVVWGLCQHIGWWRPGQRPNLTRNALGEIGPNRTEDLNKLTDAMLRFAYPGFEHNFGLWYDRRRDAHDHTRRNDTRVVAPFLEQPWARSDQAAAWDGMPKYDLTKYNDWYFEYVSPELCRTMQSSYDFIRKQLAGALPQCKPGDLIVDSTTDTWCLTDDRDTYLVYTLSGNRFQLDLSRVSGEFQVRWFNPRTGKVTSANLVTAGNPVEFTPPSSSDWAIYLQRRHR